MRGAFLDERRDAFAGVLGGEKRDLVFKLDGEHLAERGLRTVVQRLFRPCDRQRRLVGEPLRKRARFIHQRVGRNDAIEDAETMALRGINDVGGEDQLERLPKADKTRQ